MASRRETLRSQLMAEVQAITVAGGYRTDVKEVYPVAVPLDFVTAFPAVAVDLDEEVLKVADTRATVGESRINVFFIGYVSSTVATSNQTSRLLTAAADPLLSDLKRKVFECAVKYVRSQGNNWVVDRLHPIKCNVFSLPEEAKGWVEVSFGVVMFDVKSEEF
jgi:hypothetical protein